VANGGAESGLNILMLVCYILWVYYRCTKYSVVHATTAYRASGKMSPKQMSNILLYYGTKSSTDMPYPIRSSKRGDFEANGDGNGDARHDDSSSSSGSSSGSKRCIRRRLVTNYKYHPANMTLRTR
jgi:hypothetical protein